MSTTETRPNADGASLFFGDARACKEWLANLPVTNVAQSQSSLLDGLRVFNRADFEPLERLKCLELLRDRVAFMLAELRTRHFSKPLPLASGDAAAWANARLVLEEMEAGYRRCACESALGQHAALVAQRVIRYLGAQMLLHGIVYKGFDPALWTRLHQHYAACEEARIVSEPVRDSLESEATPSSVMEAYARVVLMQAAGLNEMGPQQVAFAESLLRLWSRKIAVHEPGSVGTPMAICPLVVDLDKARGAEAAPGDALAGSQRVIDTEELGRSIRRRVRALQAGEDVASLGLPAEVAGVDPLQALQRLGRRWAEPAPREAAGKAPGEAQAGLASGLADIHFFLTGGKSFEAPDKERELSRQEQNDIAVFGRVTQRTQSMMVAPQSFTLERWDVVDESLDAVRLRRRSSATKPVAVGRIVALRFGEAGPFRVGTIRSIADDPEGMFVTVGLYPGEPEATAVRGPKSAWSQGIALPANAKLGVASTLLMPGGSAVRGRSVYFWQEGAVEVRAAEVERGADYDRVTMS